MKKEYILKHKNYEVLLFIMDNESHIISDVKNIISKERLPFFIENSNNKIECSIFLNEWIKGRGIPESRKDIEEIKEIYNVKELKSLMIKAMGLNLTDHYWLHESNVNIKWEDVNHFNNVFDNVKPGEDVFPGVDNNVKDKSPNFCVDGSIEKRWYLLNNERYLIKGSKYQKQQEPFNEEIASLIMDEYNIKHVHYEQKRTKNENIPYSICKCMCDDNCEYLNAGWVFSNIDFSVRNYTSYIQKCEENGINDAKERIDEMLAVDYLIGNNDRHVGNYGIIRNSNDLKWLSINPIFDNGNSLFHDMLDDDINHFETDTFSKAFKDRNQQNLKLIGYPQWYNNKTKNITEIIYQGLRKNKKLSEKRIHKILETVKKRIEIFENEIKHKQEPAKC